MSWAATIYINSTNGIVPVELGNGIVHFIAGPNGVGKSSLLHEIWANGVPNTVAEILPGHRHIVLTNGDINQLGMTIEQLDENMRGNAATFSRYRGQWGEAHLKSFIRRASSKESNVNFRIAEAARSSQLTAQIMLENQSIIRRINQVFEAARLNITIDYVDGNMIAVRGGLPVQIDKLSDGERAALLLVCAVLSQNENGIILIDEPEKHLNPAISGPLVGSIIQARSDLCFVLASHSLELLKWSNPKSIIHVSDSQVNTPDSPHVREMRTYKLNVLSSDDEVSDDLKKSILGSKEKVLFVEGTASSDDRILYGLIYDDWSVVARGSWETVANSVKVLRNSNSYTWMLVSGLIDTDGRNTAEKAGLAAENIFCVDASTIENLFMLEPILATMAEVSHSFFGGLTGAERLERISNILPPLLSQFKSDIAYRRSVWTANRILSERKLSVKDLANGRSQVDEIKLVPIMRQHFAEYEAMLDTESALASISRIPIKNTNIPGRVARELGFDSFDKMKQSILKHMKDGEAVGAAMLDAVRQRMPTLPNS